MANRPVPLAASTTGALRSVAGERPSSDWTSRGLCRAGDPDALFVQGAAQNTAKIVCRSCPVRVQCLADALDNHVEFGVWGGMTERERRALLRRRPNVTSWRRLLEAAVREQATVRASA
jgi:WhiB family transcriptional regulator, redox-sensing transcriptional regulator